MNKFLLLLSATIAVPSLWQWSRTYKSAELFTVKPYRNYWQNVRTFAPLGLMGVASIIGVGAFYSEQSMSRLFANAFLCLMFFPIALLYFHSIAWVSEKFWAGSWLIIHYGLIGTGTYFTNGRDLANSIEIIFIFTIFAVVTVTLSLFFKHIKRILS